MTPAEVRRRLFGYLDGVVPGDTNSSARGKTVTVLTRIWSKVAPAAVGLRDDALQLYANAQPATRLALHWALTVAAYPYFLDVATHAGRLLRLQDEVQVPQLTRRLGATWGQRELVQRTAQLAARSMALWGVLRPGARPGTYLLAGAPMQVDAEAGALIAESLLLAGGWTAIPAHEIAAHPAFFPFAAKLVPSGLRSAHRLEVHRVGLDADQVSLRVVGA
jgi:hypothetical protein